MSTSSTIPLVKARILELLGQRVGLAEVQRTYAHPGKALEREAIYFGAATGEHELRVIKAGRHPRDESYDLPILVAVQVGGAVEDAESRAFELLAEVEDALADDPTLGLTPEVQWVRAGEFEMDSGWLDDGAACVISFSAKVKARLD